MHSGVVYHQLMFVGTAPTPESEASTSLTNCLLGSGCVRIGAVVNSRLSLRKPSLESRVHSKGWRMEVSLVSGTAIRLKFFMGRLQKLAKPRNFWRCIRFWGAGHWGDVWLAFLRFDVELIFQQTLKHYSNMFWVLLRVLWINQNIIQIYKHRNVKKVPENISN